MTNRATARPTSRPTANPPQTHLRPTSDPPQTHLTTQIRKVECATVFLHAFYGGVDCATRIQIDLDVAIHCATHCTTHLKPTTRPTSDPPQTHLRPTSTHDRPTSDPPQTHLRPTSDPPQTHIGFEPCIDNLMEPAILHLPIWVLGHFCRIPPLAEMSCRRKVQEKQRAVGWQNWGSLEMGRLPMANFSSSAKEMRPCKSAIFAKYSRYATNAMQSVLCMRSELRYVILNT
jgi:hypothetical protein